MKKRSLPSCLLAILIGVALPSLVRSAEPPASPEAPKGQKQMTPEEIQAKREANRKAFRQNFVKKIDQLKKKKAEGTITEMEKKNLEMFEKRLAQFDQQWSKEAQAKPAEKSEPVAPDKK